MKLQEPILFHTVEELQEAVKFGVLLDEYIYGYVLGKYTLPTLFWSPLSRELDHQCGVETLLNPNDEFLSILRQSVDWKEAREQYKPKEWYELESSIGKPVWVRDSNTEPWELVELTGYNNLSPFPYLTKYYTWRYAKPVTSQDLI